MTLPATGPVSFQDVTNLVNGAPGYSPSMSWVKGDSVPAFADMNDLHGKNYFKNNTEGACNNGNCTTNCNCGNIQCNNCVITGPIDCLNCDTQENLQAD